MFKLILIILSQIIISLTYAKEGNKPNSDHLKVQSNQFSSNSKDSINWNKYLELLSQHVEYFSDELRRSANVDVGSQKYEISAQNMDWMNIKTINNDLKVSVEIDGVVLAYNKQDISKLVLVCRVTIAKEVFKTQSELMGLDKIKFSKNVMSCIDANGNVTGYSL